jgi:hypothetical protein
MSDPLKIPKALQPVFTEVSQRIDEFCSKHLNEEYAFRLGLIPFVPGR